jgi:hypothetical protein
MIRLTCFAALFLLAACSSTDNKPATTDSAQPQVQVFETDSGRLEVPVVKGRKYGNGILKSKDGKLIGSGRFIDDQIAGAWKRFDGNGQLLSVQHFAEGQVVRTLDKTDFELRNWENKTLGIRLLVPQRWKEGQSPNPALMAVFEKSLTDTTIAQPPAVNVVRAQLQPGETLAQLAAAQLNLMHQSAARVDVVSEERFTVNNCKAFRRYGIYTADSTSIGFLNAIVISGNEAFIFSCVADNTRNSDFLAYQSVFAELVESFERIK